MLVYKRISLFQSHFSISIVTDAAVSKIRLQYRVEKNGWKNVPFRELNQGKVLISSVRGLFADDFSSYDLIALDDINQYRNGKDIQEEEKYK
jgi:hypothetical protein